MNPPTVSILLPVRNAADTLPAAIESLWTQSMDDWELLLVNDGSSDQTPTCIERFARDDPRIRLLHQPPLGLVPALHNAIRHSHSPYLARMDADDVCHPERLARQVAAMEDDPSLDLVSCRVHFGGDRNQHPGYAAHVDWLNSLLSPEEHRLNRFVESPVTHPSTLWRRETMTRHGNYRDGPFPEDYELWLRWLDAGARFRKLPHTLLTWNDPPHRLSRHHPRYAQEAFYRVKCDYLARELPPNRPVWLWGAGRVTRRRFARLEDLRGPFEGWVDIDPKKIGRIIADRTVRSPDNLPEDGIILMGVASRGARELIRDHLLAVGKRPGHDFWLCA